MSSNNVVALTTQVSLAVKQAEVLGDQISQISGGLIEQKDGMLLGSMLISGYFKDIDSLSKAVVRASFGKRIGVDVMTAVTSLYIVDGKPALEATAIRNGLTAAGYTLKTKELSDERCLLEFWYKGELLGGEAVEFTRDNAILMGFVDPACEWPRKHNIRPVRTYNKYNRQWEMKDGCECKDNWKKTGKAMLLARATTLGGRMHGNQAFKEEVYDLDELTNSNIRPDTTSVDVARAEVRKATTIDQLQEITQRLSTDDLTEVLDDIDLRTKELIEADHNNAPAADEVETAAQTQINVAETTNDSDTSDRPSASPAE